jgi:hypothetical protein
MNFSSIIDALTDSIQRFIVIQDPNRFDSELNFIVGKMSDVKVETDDKWEILQANYSRLKYLHEVVNHYNLPTEGTFVSALHRFMENIDKQTLFYLQKVDWYDRGSEFYIEAGVIKKCLESSVAQLDVFKKLEDVLKGYQILVCIVEDIRDEKCETILDEEFLNEFAPRKKKQRV